MDHRHTAQRIDSQENIAHTYNFLVLLMSGATCFNAIAHLRPVRWQGTTPLEQHITALLR